MKTIEVSDRELDILIDVIGQTSPEEGSETDAEFADLYDKLCTARGRRHGSAKPTT